ncbi:hypothetical protein M8494_15710 [Serratia ureilytica]
MAAEIHSDGAFAGKVNIRRVTIVRATASLASLMMAPTGESSPPFGLPAVRAVGLGLASALIQLTMNWAQSAAFSPTRATVIYAGEPVWAGIVGRLAGERLPAWRWGARL